MNDVCYAQSSPKKALVWTTLAFFGGFAGVSAFGPIIPKLKESMALTPVLMGLLGASPALTGSLLRIPFGALVDRYGGKVPIFILLGLSSAGMAGTLLMFLIYPDPQSHHYIFFLLTGIFCGCGIAIFSVGIPTVSYWYPQRKQGLALALYGGLGNLAPGIFAFLLPILVSTAGFISAYLLWLIMLLLIMGMFALFMKDAPYFQYKEMGLSADKDALFLACGEELVPSGTMIDSIKRAGSDYRTWILTAFYFVSFGGFIALTVWFPTYWKEYFGIGLVQAGVFTALYSLSASLLRVAGGSISDRIGGENLVWGSFTIMTIGFVLLMVPLSSLKTAIIGIFILAAGMGFANAAVFKLVPKYMPNHVGGTAGIVGGLGAFGGFVIPIFMGIFVDVVGREGYAYGFSIFVVLSLISLGLFMFLRKAHEPALEQA